MPKTYNTAHRLHPKLRVIGNGSASVNACRSEISNSVYSIQEPEPEKKEKADVSESLDLAAAQQTIHTLDLSTEVSRDILSKGGLKKRKKLKDEEVADDSFVNVFVEVIPAESKDDRADTDQAVIRIAEACNAQLKKTNLPRGLGNVITRQNIISATIPISFLEELKTDRDVSFVQPAEPLKLELPVGSRAKRPTNRRVGKENLHKQGADVLIGIIDVGGFDFAHEDFLDQHGKTKFIAIWDQGGDFRSSPEKFNYGAEFTKEHLDAAIQAQSQPGGLPATLLEPQSQASEGSHGTHVASIAAGKSGVCPKAEIAAVLIDVPVADDEFERRRFTFSDSSRILHAVEYLLEIARERKKTISINISLGTNGGSHDWSSGVNRWLDQILTIPGRSISIAAGNAGQEKAVSDGDLGWIMGRIHASGQIASRGLDVELDWVVVGNGIADVSENELEIWYSAQDRFLVEVLPPGETNWLKAGPQEFIENKRFRDGTTVSIYNELYHPANGANYISIYLSPNLEPGQIRGIRAGVWRVRLIGEEVRNGQFHCWIERDDPSEIGRIEGQRLFRFPSFFSEQSNVDSHSISTLACGNATIAVSNYDAFTNKINISSSQGPTRDNRYKPDIAGPGTNIVAAKGFSNDGDKWVSKSGTSMASPYVTGVIGLMLNTNPNLNSVQCLGILQRTARPFPGTTYEWMNDAGFGRIDPDAAVAEAASFTNRMDRT